MSGARRRDTRSREASAGGSGADGGRPGARGGGPGGVLSGLAVALGCLLFLGGFGWGVVVYKPYTVPTDSMAPTIGEGYRVLAQRISGSAVHRGDVVIFQDPAWGDLPEVKRVVGVGGDKIVCCDRQGRLTVNGTSIEEPYLHTKEPASPTGFSSSVPAGDLFLMGDHRDDSVDSRSRLTDGSHGSVPRSDVSARVDAVAWPFDGVGMMERPAAFEALPGGVSQAGPLRLMLASIVAGAVLILGGAAYGPVARWAGSRRRRTAASNAAREEVAARG
jgi:signal peptidase I